jgi:hypothetical protein
VKKDIITQRVGKGRNKGKKEEKIWMRERGLNK